MKLRIALATISGAAGMLALVCLYIGASGFSLWAVVSGFAMYGATRARKSPSHA